jgi:monothiol glutaredoxin
VKKEAPKAPSITMSPAARDGILAASKEAGGDPLRLEIGPRFQYDLFFDQEKPGDLVVRTDGVTMLFDAASAPRANGTHIDLVPGQGFRIDNPNEPPRVRAMTVTELKTLLDAKTPLELLDVRTDEERTLARIDGAKALDPSLVDTLKKDAKVVVHCHHGVRSRAAAERLVAAGFTNVFNLEGGIDAWSTTVDANVPRY